MVKDNNKLIPHLQHNYFIASNVLQIIAIPIVIEISRNALTQSRTEYPWSHVWWYTETNYKDSYKYMNI